MTNFNATKPPTQRGIRFEDGDAYDRGMGPWSRLAGQFFLDWLSPHPDLRWLDVGCGSGAFTGLIMERYSPAEVQGIDPSEGQLATARGRYGTRNVTFCRGDAMALPFKPRHFDAAVMALVIFFISDPAKGAAEMARVVRPGGWVGAYAWDVLGGGFPFDPIWEETRAAGVAPLLPPNPSAGKLQSLRPIVDSRGTGDGRNTPDFGGAHVSDIRGLLGHQHHHRRRAPGAGRDAVRGA